MASTDPWQRICVSASRSKIFLCSISMRQGRHHLLLLHKQVHDKRCAAESLHVKWVCFWEKYQISAHPLIVELLKVIAHVFSRDYTYCICSIMSMYKRCYIWYLQSTCLSMWGFRCVISKMCQFFLYKHQDPFFSLVNTNLVPIVVFQKQWPVMYSTIWIKPETKSWNSELTE